MPFALKRTVEVLHASDGTTYLLRGAANAEFELPEADQRARALLDALRTEWPSTEALGAHLAGAGHPVARADLDRELDALRSLGLLEEEDLVADLGADVAHRFDRQLAYFADTAPGRAAVLQRKLIGASVVVIGVGGLGTWTAAALACCGVGHLTLVDDDRVEPSNLNRQFLYRHADIGRLKADAAADALRAFDPGLDVTAVPERVACLADAERIVQGHAFVVELADWPPHELSRWLDAACHQARIPRISAAQFPPRMRLGPTVVPGLTACLECQERAARRDFPLYEELVAMRRARPTLAPTLGPASAMLGGALASDVVSHLTGIARPATLGAALIMDMRDFGVERHEVRRDPGCPRCAAVAPPVT